jgi:prophage tail gpP-like protein
MDDMLLLVDGNTYGGWTSINVHRSMELGADAFELEATDVGGGSAERRPIRMGAACQVFIGDKKIITGHVDDVSVSYDAKKRSLSFAGRSRIADLADCALPLSAEQRSQFSGLTLAQIAQRLAKPFGLKVIDQVGGMKPSVVTTFEPGDRVFEFIESLARQEAVILGDDVDGNLVIYRASTVQLSTALRLGVNIRSASGQFSLRDRFSEYRFVGQAWGSDEMSGAQAAHIFGSAKDALVPRYRPTVLHLEENITLENASRRAQWQANVNYGRSRAATYTVTGWAHADGLWEPNRLVQVFDDWMGFDGEWLMIAGVRYVFDKSGRRTELEVMPPEAFDLVPLPIDPKEAAW